MKEKTVDLVEAFMAAEQIALVVAVARSVEMDRVDALMESARSRDLSLEGDEVQSANRVVEAFKRFRLVLDENVPL